MTDMTQLLPAQSSLTLLGCIGAKATVNDIFGFTDQADTKKETAPVLKLWGPLVAL